MKTAPPLAGRTKARRILAAEPAVPPVGRHLGRVVEVTGCALIQGEPYFRIDYLHASRPTIAFVPCSDVTF